MLKSQKPATRIQQKKRAEILAAGLEVFSQYGFHGATLDQVADTAGLSKPNILYYFPSKEAIYTTLLAQILENWLAPLQAIDAHGDPVEQIMNYAYNKLRMSRDFPRESRLFANEIIQGAPRISNVLETELKPLVDEIAGVIQKWIDQGKIRHVDPHHLIFSIWSVTQHYADFEVQVRVVMGDRDPFEGAESHLNLMLSRMLTI